MAPIEQQAIPGNSQTSTLPGTSPALLSSSSLLSKLLLASNPPLPAAGLTPSGKVQSSPSALLPRKGLAPSLFSATLSSPTLTDSYSPHFRLPTSPFTPPTKTRFTYKDASGSLAPLVLSVGRNTTAGAKCSPVTTTEFGFDTELLSDGPLHGGSTLPQIEIFGDSGDDGLLFDPVSAEVLAKDGPAVVSPRKTRIRLVSVGAPPSKDLYLEVAEPEEPSDLRLAFKWSSRSLSPTRSILKGGVREWMGRKDGEGGGLGEKVVSCVSRSNLDNLDPRINPDLDTGVTQWAFVDTGLTDQALTPFLEDLVDPTPYRALLTAPLPKIRVR
ncbi:hypothetical protein BC829DRAFT_443510 [Chytridium lagenaria]|nr:hypothetical protein BC829DRAFT_443510 [Chytridium lagenaria]